MFFKSIVKKNPIESLRKQELELIQDCMQVAEIHFMKQISTGRDPQYFEQIVQDIQKVKKKISNGSNKDSNKGEA